MILAGCLRTGTDKVAIIVAFENPLADDFIENTRGAGVNEAPMSLQSELESATHLSRDGCEASGHLTLRNRDDRRSS